MLTTLYSSDSLKLALSFKLSYYGSMTELEENIAISSAYTQTVHVEAFATVHNFFIFS